MKSLHKLVLSSSLAAIGLFGLQGSAMAASFINGNICTAQPNAPGASALFRSANGISNSSGTNRLFVFCPVVRSTEATASGWSIVVDGVVNVGRTFTCTLNSYSFSNTFLGQTSFSATGVPGTGAFSRVLVLPQSQVQRFSHQSLFCVLPPNAVLSEIEPD